MTDDNSFFKYVWRFNALVIALLFSLSVVFIIWSMLANQVGRQNVTIKAEPPQNLSLETHMRYDRSLSGHNAFIYELYTEGDYENIDLSLSAKMRMGKNRQDVNFAVYNLDSQNSKWAFENNSQIILGRFETTSNVSQDSEKKNTTGFVVQVVEKDTNGDGLLSAIDNINVYTYSTFLDKKRLVLEGLESQIIIKRISDDRYLFIYKKDGELNLAEYNRSTFSLGLPILIEKP